MNHRDADVGMRVPVPQDALRFVILLGVTSLFADMTYEGARSITGPYLGSLGASGTAIGVISGFGDLIGYALRLVSGLVADRTGRYWSITLLGYAINVLAVPLLALARTLAHRGRSHHLGTPGEGRPDPRRVTRCFPMPPSK